MDGNARASELVSWLMFKIGLVSASLQSTNPFLSLVLLYSASEGI